MLALENERIEYIDHSLVLYRRHPGAITNETPPAPNRAAVAARERTQMGFAGSQHALLELFRRRLRQRGDHVGDIEPLLHDDMQLFALRARWDKSTLAQRLVLLGAAKRRRQLDWLVPRLVGFKAFVAAKAFALARRATG